MYLIKEITLDFSGDSEPQVITAKQCDSESRYILITPVNKGAELDMNGIAAVFCAEKPDGKRIVNYCTVYSDGRISVELTSQALAVNGVLRCEIKLYEDSAVLSSCPFCVNVVKSVSDDGFESTDEYSVLTLLIEEYREIIKSVNADTVKSYIFLPETAENVTEESLNNSLSIDENVTETTYEEVN